MAIFRFVLGFVVTGLKETLQSLHVISSRPQTVRVRRKCLRIDVVQQLVEINFTLHAQVHYGKVQVGKRPKLSIRRILYQNENIDNQI